MLQHSSANCGPNGGETDLFTHAITINIRHNDKWYPSGFYADYDRNHSSYENLVYLTLHSPNATIYSLNLENYIFLEMGLSVR